MFSSWFLLYLAVISHRLLSIFIVYGVFWWYNGYSGNVVKPLALLGRCGTMGIGFTTLVPRLLPHRGSFNGAVGGTNNGRNATRL